MSEMAADKRSVLKTAVLTVLRRRTTAVIVGVAIAALALETTVWLQTLLASTLVMVFAAVWPFESLEIRGGDARPSRADMLVSAGAAILGGYLIHQLLGAELEQLLVGLAIGAVVGYWALGDFKSMLAQE